MLKRTFFLLILSLSISSACERDDEGSSDNLAFTATNLAGDWQRTGEFKGQPNDSLGIKEPSEDLFSQFESCRKDDMIRYVRGTQEMGNTYFWGIGKNACHSQMADSFIEIGNWELQESGVLSHSYNGVNELFVVIFLTRKRLLIRSELGIREADGTVYQFTDYERIK
ncbi:hypothetical protein [Flagellimonas pacifica]|uniref:Lipocalin-like domain-containing protein n=1 Tax=Flagellimonas pacifica TaxID=1247520 RepID=A0A285N055_9FLAO|nr:hypothetical protein [Allomuricauda parva]SNZ01406.1 hypothetical protein SAMN06265377_3244 [Allomuricauda parva]